MPTEQIYCASEFDPDVSPVFPELPGGLKVKNAHTRDQRIQFFEEGHIYDVDGKRNFLSATSLAKLYHPEFNPEQAIGGIVRKYGEVPLQDQPDTKVIDTGKYAGMTREQIRSSWEENGRRASNAGTLMHARIEFFYNGWCDHFPYHTPPEYHTQFSAFQKEVVEAQGLVPYRTEWFVFDEDLELAGSIDMTYKASVDDDQKLYIYDWKRSCKLEQKTNRWESLYSPLEHMPNTKYHQYSMQLNIYRHILEHRYGKRIEGMFLVGMHPDLHTYQVEPVARLETETEAIFALRQEQVHQQQEQQHPERGRDAGDAAEACTCQE
jgi:hypothetical protein